jgi:hypothetical protein
MNKYGKNIKQNISTPKIKVIIKRTYCYTENKKIINYISDTHAFSREDTKWFIYMIMSFMKDDTESALSYMCSMFSEKKREKRFHL